MYLSVSVCFVLLPANSIFAVWPHILIPAAPDCFDTTAAARKLAQVKDISVSERGGCVCVCVCLDQPKKQFFLSQSEFTVSEAIKRGRRRRHTLTINNTTTQHH